MLRALLLTATAALPGCGGSGEPADGGSRAPVNASVNFVAPYVVPDGAAGEVIIRGRGFSALNAESLSVQFNSILAISRTIVSDTELRAAYPALASGTYSISVSSSGPAMPSRAGLKLVVVEAPKFKLTTIQRPTSAGRPTNLIYDAERQALFFIDAANRRILRYALSGNGSTSMDTEVWVGRIALSPDGTELIKTGSLVNGRYVLLRLDPVTLSVRSSVPADVAGTGAFDTIAFANDGGGIGNGRWPGFPSLYRYDLLTQAFTAVSWQPDFMTARHVFASADGRTLVLAYMQSDAIDTRVYTYDASRGTLTAQPVTTSTLNTVSVSRNASRIILVNDSSPTPTTVYDAQFNALGTLPNGASTFVLSPDGNLAYAYYPINGTVRKFELTASGVSEVGTGSAVAPANTDMSEMAISPDGGSLFLVGTTSVVIAPAP